MVAAAAGARQRIEQQLRDFGNLLFKGRAEILDARRGPRGVVPGRKFCRDRERHLPQREEPRCQPANLACLQDCVNEKAVFRRDADSRRKLESRLGDGNPVCCVPKGAKQRAGTRSHA